MRNRFLAAVGVGVAMAACATGQLSDLQTSIVGDASIGNGSTDARSRRESVTALNDAGVAELPPKDKDAEVAEEPLAQSDAVAGAPDAHATVDAGGAPTGCPSRWIINEVQTETVDYDRVWPQDEFVELYNVGESCGPVTMKLVYRSKTGNSDISLGSWSVSMEKGTYVVVAGRGFKGASDSILSSSLAADSGQLQLRIGNEVLDSLGYGGTSGAFVRGTSAPKPPANGSIGRFEGRDTGDNSADFYALAAPTPGAANPAAP